MHLFRYSKKQDLSPSCQLVTVVGRGVKGVLRRFERESVEEPWVLVGGDVPVNLGRSGINVEKREGDGRSPEGLFPLGPVFGDEAHQVGVQRMPYLLITEDLEWVDDPDSKYYNRPVKGVERDWKSSEKMGSIGRCYCLGVVVQYNMDPAIKGLGSAIFLHVEGAGATEGCTSMKREDLCLIASWLDEAKHPLLLQLAE